MTSIVLALWRRPLGRARFAVVSALIAILVWLLPGVVGAALSSAFRKAGADPAMGILSQLLFVSIVLPALLALFAPLTIAARMRLRDLDLSGALVILFPLIALTPLSAFVAARVNPLMPTAGLGGSPLAHFGVQLALLFGLVLSVAPGRLAGRPLASPVVDLLRQWTDCEGTIDRSTFRRRAGPTLAGCCARRRSIGLVWSSPYRSSFW